MKSQVGLTEVLIPQHLTTSNNPEIKHTIWEQRKSHPSFKATYIEIHSWNAITAEKGNTGAKIFELSLHIKSRNVDAPTYQAASTLYKRYSLHNIVICLLDSGKESPGLPAK